MKTKSLWLALSLFAFIAPAIAFAEFDNRALTLEVRGKNGGFDILAYEETRHKISEFIADGSVDRFVVYRYYSNGGFAGCVELAVTALGSRLRELRDHLLGIHYDTSTTAYYVGVEKHCR